LRSKKKIEAEKRREMHWICNEEKAKLSKDYVVRETAGAKERVEDAERAVQQEFKDLKQAEIARLMNRELEKTFEGMMVAIGDSLSDLASSDDGEDEEVEDDEKTEQVELSKDDEPDWVMGTIIKMVHQHMKRF
jgi:hypothetical protein